MFAQIISEVKPKVIIKVGVWKGQSTIHMTEIAKEINPKVILIAIDTSLGSPEHWKAKYPIVDITDEIILIKPNKIISPRIHYLAKS